ncbi:MAG: hypothetical protein HRU15_03500 [Planctomycetes bacterium]|nr:hypothetical protein [Planctomycetota bacterium]
MRDSWDIICKLATDAAKPELASALTACKVLACSSSELRLEVPVMYRAQLSKGHPDRVFFEQILKQCVHKELSIQILTGGMASGDDENQNEQQQRLSHYRQAQQDPVIKKLLETFDANIIAREPSAREQWLKQFHIQDEQN